MSNELGELHLSKARAPADSQPAQLGAVVSREEVLDLIDECPGLTMEQDHWLSRRVKELDTAQMSVQQEGSAE